MGRHSIEARGNTSTGNFDAMFSDMTPQEMLTAKRDQVLDSARGLTVGLFNDDGMEVLLKSGMLQEVARAADNTSVALSMKQGNWVTTSTGMARIDTYRIPRGGIPELEMTYASTVTHGGTPGNPEVHPDLQNATSVNISEHRGAMSVKGTSFVNGVGTPYMIDGNHDVDANDPHDRSAVLQARNAVDEAGLAITEIVAQAQQMVGAESAKAGAHAA